MFVEALVASPVQSRPDTLADQRSEAKIDARQSSLKSMSLQFATASIIDHPAGGRAWWSMAWSKVCCRGSHSNRMQRQCIGAASNPAKSIAVDLSFSPTVGAVACRFSRTSPFAATWNVVLARLTHWIGDRGHYAITSHLDQDSAAWRGIGSGAARSGRSSLRSTIETGTIHLLAVSGLHVGIVAVAAVSGWRSSWDCPELRVVMRNLVCLIYMLVTGARPPVIRAATLITLFLIGQMLGRRTDSMNTLATAAILLMLLDPLSISQVWHPSVFSGGRHHCAFHPAAGA
ncbi:MAG: ComEC/Rec2 family competence protein [Pirellulaceae bacterium]